MEAFLVSVAVVALGEIGDKTQLLALILAARFRRPWPIVAGILVATLVNHALAGLVGNWIRARSSRRRAALAGRAVVLRRRRVGAEARQDRRDARRRCRIFGVFGVTVVSFFLAEMGDKTQVATIVLAARFDALAQVVVGTTVGMLVANVPVVFAGKLAAERIPFKAVRIAAALLFAALGAWVLYAGIPAT